MQASTQLNHSAKPNARLSLIYLTPLAALSILSIVIPNSLQIGTAAALVLCFVISLFYISKKDPDQKYLKLIYITTLTTIIYMIVGVLNGAPNEAIAQVTAIYIISPILWFFILTTALKKIGEEKIIDALKPIAILCTISVGAFFFLFLNFGADSVSFLRESANVNIKDGYSGATMHVYGSLIFLTGAFFSATDVFKNNISKITTLGLLFVCAITSGRSALILAAPLGIAISFFLAKSNVKKKSNKTTSPFYAAFALIIGAAITYNLFKVDILIILEHFIDELLSGGGSERSQQSIALIEGALSSYGLGSGHGIGVDYIRSYDYPWRYESVWFATLHRTGIIGTFIYALPAAIYIFQTLKISIKHGLSASERFFFGGFICAFAASNTNPYIEAVPFQWIYILPVVAFLMRETHKKIYFP